MSRLQGYEGFSGTPTVKLFGLVFHRSVQLDASVRSRYGAYPLVTGWNERNEASPWRLKPASPNLYDPNLDLSTLTVVGNKSVAGATFHPSSWQGYVHPEGIDGVATPTGDMGNAFKVLVHEMGHCFFLDDLYDTHKYPTAMPCECSRCAALSADDSVMWFAPTLRPLDHAMLRRTWDQRLRR